MSSGHVTPAIKTAVLANTVFDAVLDAAAIYAWYDDLGNKIDGNYDEASAVRDTSNGMYRQAIVNDNFNRWAKGVTFTNPVNGSYSADQWQTNVNADSGTLPTTIIHLRQQFPAGFLDKSFYYYSMSFNGAGSGFGVNAYAGVFQPIEFGTRNLCGVGKKVTISFWARSSLASKRIGVGLSQRYGTGGSPSATESLTTVGQIITLTTSFTKYTLTFTTNTLSGKTFGTNNDDQLLLQFFTMWGTGSATNNLGGGSAESFGGSGTLDIAQVQVNAGDTALPFQPKDPALEMIPCKRFIYALTDSVNNAFPVGFGTAATTTIALINVPIPVEMRTQPTLVATAADWQLTDGAAAVDVTAISIQPNQNSKNMITLRVTVAAGLTAFRPYALNADGTVGRLMIFDATL